jgi:DMSO/TMAO reductase YedYZ heme-binding membrane subunit
VDRAALADVEVSESTNMNDSTKLPQDRLWQPTTAKWLFVVLGATLAYAILRYHIASGVSWSHFPLFIMNKAVSLAATVLVACSYLVGRVLRWHDDDPRKKLVVVKFCGLVGFSFAALHAIASLCVLTPAYFAKYFSADGRLNLEGELGLIVGIVALWALSLPAITTLPMMPKALGGVRWKRSQRMGYVCLSLVVVHVVVLGLRGWLSPRSWPWMLPPISLVAAVAAAVPLFVRRARERSRRNVTKSSE